MTLSVTPVMRAILAAVWLSAGAIAAPPAAAQQARGGPVPPDSAMAYQIWMRSFTPEGALRAATAKLPHIAGLGATIVYLSPINLQSTAGGYSNPYRIKDHCAIDPEYDTDADLKAFTGEAHRLGLKVLMDVVFYHTAPDSVMMQRPDSNRKLSVSVPVAVGADAQPLLKGPADAIVPAPTHVGVQLGPFGHVVVKARTQEVR